MATYRVTDPKTGRTLRLTGDSPPTEQELEQIFFSVGPSPQQTEPSLVGKAWNALSVPEQKSREGLQMIAQAVSPKTETTGNLARDVVMNLPRIGAETLAETAPSFVSRGAIVTAGAIKVAKAVRPTLSAIRKGVFGVLEKTSGLAPRQAGALEKAYQDPTLIFAKGREAGGKFYEAAKATAKEVGDDVAQMVRPDRAPKVVSTAIDKANASTLKPLEALKARKAIDVMMESKTYMKDDLIPLRKTFDVIAKSDPNIAMGDQIVSRGVTAQALRMPFPTNIGGTFSGFRTAMGGAAGAMIPGGKVLAPIALSPLIQGAGATTLGAASKVVAPIIANPKAAVAAVAAIKKTLTEKKAREYLRKAKGDKEKAREMAINDGWQIPE